MPDKMKLNSILALLTLMSAAAVPSFGQPAKSSQMQLNHRVPEIRMSAAVELATGLDAARAKVGDPVTARMKNDVLSGGKVIASAEKATLIGHVTDVRPSTRSNPESVMGIQFDKLVVSGGPEIPIKAGIQEVLAPEHSTIIRPARAIASSSNAAVIPARAASAQGGPASQLNKIKSEVEGIVIEERPGGGMLLRSAKQNVRLDPNTRVNMQLTNAAQ
jgi:hypothetical protein